MKTANVQSRITRGFTLIEVLIALVIFAVGLLGLGLQLSKGIKNTVNKDVYSSVFPLAMQSIEPLNQAILLTADSFNQALSNLNGAGFQPAFETNTIKQSQFYISIDRAVDSNSNNLLDTNTQPWLPPYTVVLNITYNPANTDTSLNFKSTHVFVPPKGS